MQKENKNIVTFPIFKTSSLNKQKHNGVYASNASLKKKKMYLHDLCVYLSTLQIHAGFISESGM